MEAGGPGQAAHARSLGQPVVHLFLYLAEPAGGPSGIGCLLRSRGREGVDDAVLELGAARPAVQPEGPGEAEELSRRRGAVDPAPDAPATVARRISTSSKDM